MERTNKTQRTDPEVTTMEEVVLLVDDDRNLVRGLARLLHNQPYRLYTANSGTEALLILKSRRVDVVVTDEQMPEMRGGELLAWIASHCPDVVGIVLTGRPTVDDAIRAINEGGVFQYLTKPCNPGRLADTIRKALEHKAQLISGR